MTYRKYVFATIRHCDRLSLDAWKLREESGCADEEVDEELYKEVHSFLGEQGNINFGILRGEPLSGKLSKCSHCEDIWARYVGLL
jgi:hypothetical protein